MGAVKRLFRIVIAIFVAAVVLFVLRCSMRKPSNARAWAADQQRLATAEFRGPLVTVKNVRNFTYRSESDYTAAYDQRTYDLRKLDSVWFVVEPFGKIEGPAHTFVTFGFDGGREFVGISVEIRKERGESFSALKGLFREYEIMYVVADERDLITLRAIHRNDDVYLYRVRTTPEKMRKMFLGMLARANKLAAEPEFYNTLTNTCTTNIVHHVNDVTPKRIPLRLGVLLPGYSGQLAYELGLIENEIPFELLRERSHVNDEVRLYANHPQFSQRIRGLKIDAHQ